MTLLPIPKGVIITGEVSIFTKSITLNDTLSQVYCWALSRCLEKDEHCPERPCPWGTVMCNGKCKTDCRVSIVCQTQKYRVTMVASD